MMAEQMTTQAPICRASSVAADFAEGPFLPWPLLHSIADAGGQFGVTSGREMATLSSPQLYMADGQILLLLLRAVVGFIFTVIPLLRAFLAG
jgi:hypothetical protein